MGTRATHRTLEYRHGPAHGQAPLQKGSHDEDHKKLNPRCHTKMQPATESIPLPGASRELILHSPQLEIFESSTTICLLRAL